MGYQRDRDEFLSTLAREGVDAATARLILRHAQTYKRLAERECNGDDWQSDDLVPCPLTNADPARFCRYCGGPPARVTASYTGPALLDRQVVTVGGGRRSDPLGGEQAATSGGWASISILTPIVTHGRVSRSTLRMEALEARITSLCSRAGIVPAFSGDPRGVVVKLRLRSGKANDFGGEGYYCVPTRY